MPTKTFNISLEALHYLDTIPGKNGSSILDNLILEHRGLSPQIRKQEALAQLRASASTLASDHDIDQRALVAYVIRATGGE